MTLPLPVRTRDGGFSVAAAIEDARDDRVPTDRQGAIAWATANSVFPIDGMLLLERVNTHRRALNLPPFRIVKASQGGATILPQEVASPLERRATGRNSPRKVSA